MTTAAELAELMNQNMLLAAERVIHQSGAAASKVIGDGWALFYAGRTGMPYLNAAFPITGTEASISEAEEWFER
jgi:hypothetical protein